MTPPAEDGSGGPGIPTGVQNPNPMIPAMPSVEGAAPQPNPMEAQMGGGLSVPQPNPVMPQQPQQAQQVPPATTPPVPAPAPKTTNKPHKSTKGISKNPKTAKKLSIMKSVIGKVNTSNAYKPTGKTRKPVF
jgi:hypothetical protein